MQKPLVSASFSLMKDHEKELEKISFILINELKKNDYFRLGENESKLRGEIKAIFLDNLKSEEQIDREVKRIMASYSSQIEKGEVDSRKVFGMIKSKIAKEKGFIL